MILDDKQLMFSHLNTIRMAIENLDDEETQYACRLNLKLIALRDEIRDHGRLRGSQEGGCDE